MKMSDAGRIVRRTGALNSFARVYSLGGKESNDRCPAVGERLRRSPQERRGSPYRIMRQRNGRRSLKTETGFYYVLPELSMLLLVPEHGAVAEYQVDIFV